jgi:hypothetical protein
MTTTGTLDVRRGASQSADPATAVRELHDAIGNPDAALVLVFCSVAYDLAAIARELRSRFGDAPVLGCTTAGEIGPAGYLQGSLSGVSIAGPGFHARTVRIDGVSQAEIADGESAARAVSAAMRAAGQPAAGEDVFAFLIADGMSMHEEVIVSGIYRSLGVPLAGGSAADGARFGSTFVLHEGEFHPDAAILTLVHSEYPFLAFKTEHFVPSTERMIVTGADPPRRLVTEINGEPAAAEYARVIGLTVDQLTPTVFATHPVVVKVGGAPYVRSIQKVSENGSLTFFCAIDHGIVLTVARSVDLVQNLEEAFERVETNLGAPAIVLGFDCILRSLEADTRDLKARIGEVMTRHKVVGFATYGEQFSGMHVNQTFTAIALAAELPASSSATVSRV